MSSDDALLHLAPYREGKMPDPRVGKALKAIENDSLAREKLAQQLAFDKTIRETFNALGVPPDLRTRLKDAATGSGKKKRAKEALTAMICVGVGALVIIGVLIFIQWDARKNFPGREALIKLVQAGTSTTAGEFAYYQPPNAANKLGDWFYMRGFDNYQVPPELSAAPAVGSRVFRQNGKLVAQVAIEPHNSLVFLFKPEEFGVQLPEGDDWSVFQVDDDWAAAARRGDRANTLVSFRGTESEMRDFLKELPK